MRASAQIVSESRLRLSRAPVAELAASALDAANEAGLEAATFIVVAVEPGKGTDKVRRAIELAASTAA